MMRLLDVLFMVYLSDYCVVMASASAKASSFSTADLVREDLGLDPISDDENFFFPTRTYEQPIIRNIITTADIILGRGDDGRNFDVDLFGPIRLVRSTLLGLLAAEIWDKVGPLRRLGFFRRRMWKERKEENVTNYRRVKKHMSLKRDHLDDGETQLFKEGHSRRQTFTSKEKTFDNLISESLESTSLLSVSDKEELLSRYKVGSDEQKHPNQNKNQLVDWHRRWSRRRRAKRIRNNKTAIGRRAKKKKKKKRTSIIPRVMAKRKFAIGWSVGHLLSPLLWLTPVGGWIVVCCVVAELVNSLDDKQQQQIDSNYHSSSRKITKIIPIDKELLEFVGFLRSHTIKTILIGSMVGAAISKH